MFTDCVDAPEDELNERIPLSAVRWHQHMNFCAAPADKVKEYHGDKPKFGMFGSIHTKRGVRGGGRDLLPSDVQLGDPCLSMVIHVFPYGEKLTDIFSMNDGVAHVH